MPSIIYETKICFLAFKFFIISNRSICPPLDGTLTGTTTPGSDKWRIDSLLYKSSRTWLLILVVNLIGSITCNIFLILNSNKTFGKRVQSFKKITSCFPLYVLLGELTLPHTHTHTHIYIYIYISSNPGRSWLQFISTNTRYESSYSPSTYA